jgi:hypothetical protein
MLFSDEKLERGTRVIVVVPSDGGWPVGTWEGIVESCADEPREVSRAYEVTVRLDDTRIALELRGGMVQSRPLGEKHARVYPYWTKRLHDEIAARNAEIKELNVRLATLKSVVLPAEVIARLEDIKSALVQRTKGG